MDYLEGITYPHDVACQITEVLNHRPLVDLKREMQEEHRTLGARNNKIPVLIDLANSGSIPSLQRIILERIKKARCCEFIKHKLNEPTLEAFRVLDSAGLPRNGSVVFSSTATANSGNDDAVTTALNILGWCSDDKGIIYER
jgi:hypothetical protein